MRNRPLLYVVTVVLALGLSGCILMTAAPVNLKEFNFYGKVVDQFGQPLAGVEANGATLLVISPVSSASRYYQRTSDAAGRFAFVGVRGADLGVLVKKPGYESNGRSDLRENEKSSPNRPAVFTLWKLQGAEPMTHMKVITRVPYDGQSATFDLRTGQKSPAGEFMVTLVRSPLQRQRSDDHFDWNVQIELEGGGLVESADPYPYLAPEWGYQPTWKRAQTKDDPEWTYRMSHIFYVHTAQGQYGRLRFDLWVDSDDPETGIVLESWLNPAGSRNLEFDLAKEIKPAGAGRGRGAMVPRM